MPRTLKPMRRVASVVAVAVVCLGAVGCSDDSKTGDTARFCEQVEINLDALRAIPQTPEEVDELLALWRHVGEVAPLSIEPDWQAHILNFQTALESDDMEEVYARIYATERSSVAVASFVSEQCGFDWGPVTTIVPQTTTTLAPTTTAG